MAIRWVGSVEGPHLHFAQFRECLLSVILGTCMRCHTSYVEPEFCTLLACLEVLGLGFICFLARVYPC